MSELAYPLTWPAGWPRTPRHQREHGAFDGTLDRIRVALLKEINLIVLGVAQARYYTIKSQIVISSNMPLRRDGEIHAGAREPDDPGVAVYFERKKIRVCLACDKFDRVWKNLRAIQKTVEAMRGIERWGSSQLLDRAFTGFAALEHRTGPSCWETLGLDAPALDEIQVIAAFREQAKAVHPDVPGGSEDAFRELNAAKDIALATLRGR